MDEPPSLEAVAAASPEAKAALDDYLTTTAGAPSVGTRSLEPTLGERPDLVLATIRHALGRRPPRTRAGPGTGPAHLPEADRATFDELLADARDAYRLQDDDVGLTYIWPMGLLRRRCSTPSPARRQGAPPFRRPLRSRAAGDRRPPRRGGRTVGSGPRRADRPARGRGRRCSRRSSSASRARLGAAEPLPPTVARLAAARDLYWGAGGRPEPGRLRGVGIGGEVARGRACVISTPGDLGHLEPGDVLVAVATSTSLNAAFPLVAAVATAEGGAFSHAAILSREYAVPAVVGVAGLLDEVHDGDLVEVDPGAGAVRVIARAGAA